MIVNGSVGGVGGGVDVVACRARCAAACGENGIRGSVVDVGIGVVGAKEEQRIARVGARRLNERQVNGVEQKKQKLLCVAKVSKSTCTAPSAYLSVLLLGRLEAHHL